MPKVKITKTSGKDAAAKTMLPEYLSDEDEYLFEEGLDESTKQHAMNIAAAAAEQVTKGAAAEQVTKGTASSKKSAPRKRKVAADHVEEGEDGEPASKSKTAPKKKPKKAPKVTFEEEVLDEGPSSKDNEESGASAAAAAAPAAEKPKSKDKEKKPKKKPTPRAAYYFMSPDTFYAKPASDDVYFGEEDAVSIQPEGKMAGPKSACVFRCTSLQCECEKCKRLVEPDANDDDIPAPQEDDDDIPMSQVGQEKKLESKSNDEGKAKAKAKAKGMKMTDSHTYPWVPVHTEDGKFKIVPFKTPTPFSSANVSHCAAATAVCPDGSGEVHVQQCKIAINLVPLSCSYVPPNPTNLAISTASKSFAFCQYHFQMALRQQAPYSGYTRQK